MLQRGQLIGRTDWGLLCTAGMAFLPSDVINIPHDWSLHTYASS